MHFRPKYVPGTTSGGTSEDDRSEKSGGSGIGAAYGDLAEYPFRINVIDIDKKTSPLFRHFEGNVKVLLPYIGADQPMLGISENKNDETVSSLRVHLSEVTFLYGEKHTAEVHPVTYQDRNRIFLAQTALAPKRNGIGIFTLPESSDRSYDHLIHDFRPINRIVPRVIHVNGEEELVSEAYPGNSSVYMVITRSESSKLDPEDNLYTVGIVDFSLQNPPMPQLYQRVKVWVDEGKKTNVKDIKPPVNRIDIWGKSGDRPRAILRVASSIQLVFDDELEPEFTVN